MAGKKSRAMGGAIIASAVLAIAACGALASLPTRTRSR